MLGRLLCRLRGRHALIWQVVRADVDSIDQHGNLSVTVREQRVWCRRCGYEQEQR